LYDGYGYCGSYEALGDIVSDAVAAATAAAAAAVGTVPVPGVIPGATTPLPGCNAGLIGGLPTGIGCGSVELVVAALCIEMCNADGGRTDESNGVGFTKHNGSRIDTGTRISCLDTLTETERERERDRETDQTDRQRERERERDRDCECISCMYIDRLDVCLHTCHSWT
jgi:hypothetical protein